MNRMSIIMPGVSYVKNNPTVIKGQRIDFMKPRHRDSYFLALCSNISPMLTVERYAVIHLPSYCLSFATYSWHHFVPLASKCQAYSYVVVYDRAHIDDVHTKEYQLNGSE